MAAIEFFSEGIFYVRKFKDKHKIGNFTKNIDYDKAYGILFLINLPRILGFDELYTTYQK